MNNSCENCTHYPVCENKNYNIVKPCDFYMEEKKGEWIKEDKPWGGFGDSVLVLTCSECSESFIYHGNEPKFCSECGAEMEADNDKTN